MSENAGRTVEQMLAELVHHAHELSEAQRLTADLMRCITETAEEKAAVPAEWRPGAVEHEIPLAAH
ncbi:hypothetical protein [Roseomonas populi]|uniref:Uncharacterized protein n=1 Tax=Roseomonas populi TaxID=3121582 RepID=A0ABT1WY86_9PROT|nr:hypothetical protein [Roseomonas pecuniae]MCR0980805.1 hypothetical protein [Roseomonas pecuniae]